MQDSPSTTPTLRPNANRRAMPPRKVLKALRARFGTLEAFALHIDKNRSFVSEVLNGHEVSAPIARLIADVVGREPHEIWPRLYAEDGGPKSSAYRRAS